MFFSSVCWVVGRGWRERERERERPGGGPENSKPKTVQLLEIHRKMCWPLRFCWDQIKNPGKRNKPSCSHERISISSVRPSVRPSVWLGSLRVLNLLASMDAGSVDDEPNRSLLLLFCKRSVILARARLREVRQEQVRRSRPQEGPSTLKELLGGVISAATGWNSSCCFFSPFHPYSHPYSRSFF
jgi:hypothetical protein